MTQYLKSHPSLVLEKYCNQSAMSKAIEGSRSDVFKCLFLHFDDYEIPMDYGKRSTLEEVLCSKLRVECLNLLLERKSFLDSAFGCKDDIFTGSYMSTNCYHEEIQGLYYEIRDHTDLMCIALQYCIETSQRECIRHSFQLLHMHSPKALKQTAWYYTNSKGNNVQQTRVWLSSTLDRMSKEHIVDIMWSQWRGLALVVNRVPALHASFIGEETIKLIRDMISPFDALAEKSRIDSLRNRKKSTVTDIGVEYDY